MLEKGAPLSVSVDPVDPEEEVQDNDWTHWRLALFESLKNESTRREIKVNGDVLVE